MAGPFCSGCGEKLRPEARFCDRCGRSVDGAAHGALGGEMYRSTSLVVGQQRVAGALGMAMVGILIIIMGAAVPVPDGFLGGPGRTFSTISTIMGSVVLAFSVLIYLASKRQAERR